MNAIKTYNRESLDKLKLWLTNMKSVNHTKYYEILVDGMRVVYKTEDIEDFDNYRKWVTEDTQSLRLMIYNTKNSHRSQIFEFRTEKFMEGASERLYHTRSRKLSEVEIEERARTLFNEQQKEQELVELRLQNVELKQQNAELLKRVSDADQYIDKQDRELNNYKVKESNGLAKTIEDLAGKFFGATNAGNAPTADTNTLNDTNTTNTQEEPLTCSFKKKTSAESSEKTMLSDTEKQELEILLLAKQNLGKENYTKVCAVFDFLVNNPDFIKTVHESITGV